MGFRASISRRHLLKRVVPACLAAVVSTRPSLGQQPSASSSEASSSEAIWSGDYWAKKGDLPLYIYRKRLGPPKSGQKARPILFLAHGSSVSAKPTFDLSVPGKGAYSMMDQFANYGFDVWTMDFEGYGRSGSGPGNSDIASGVEDLKAAAAVVLRETGQKRFHMYGESSGSLRAGAFAMTEPERVLRLCLGSFTWTGQGSPTLSKRSDAAQEYRTHNRRPRDRAMIRSIFTRDKPGTSDPAVAEAMADAELKFGTTVPTGTYLDMTTRLPIVDPLRLKCPVLIVRGEYDGIATEEDLLSFFRKLPVPDREIVILPGASHSLGLGFNRDQFWQTLRCFIDRPPRHDVNADHSN
jgi:alpha-beta hydrolase superfamily lysophospholipase